MKGPETYLETIGIRPSCLMRADKPAVLDAAHRAQLNHEIFFFSSPSLRKLFLGDPLRWCGVLTDPVSGLRFQPDKTAPKTGYEGRTYFFSSAETEAAFKADPPMYQDAKRVMPKPAVPAGASETSPAGGASTEAPAPKP